MRALLGASLPSLPWARLALAAAAAPAGTWLLIRAPEVTATGVIRATLVACVPLALAVASVLDDPSDDWISYTPIPRSARRCARVLLAAPAVAVGWGATLVVAWLRLDDMRPGPPTAGSAVDPTALPWFDLTVGAAALWIIALAAASIAARRDTDWQPGFVAATTVVVACSAAVVLPEHVALVADWAPRRVDPPGQSDGWHVAWTAARNRWAALAAAGAAITALAWLDPGRRNPAFALRDTVTAGGRTERREVRGRARSRPK